MKIVFLVSQYNPNVLKWGAALQKEHEVEVIIWDRYGVSSEILAECEFKDLKLKFFRLKVPTKNFVLPFFYPLWWLYAFITLFNKNIEILHPFDLDSLIPMLFLKRFKKVKLYYTIADFYADTIPLVYPHILRRFLSNLERYLLEKADHIFLVDENRFNNIKGCKIKGLTYIYNTPADTKISYKNEDKIENDSLNIFYAGLLDDQRGIKFLIKAVIESNNVNLKIAGKGPLQSYVESISEKYPEKISYLGFISHAKVLDFSASADIIVAFYDPKVPINKIASPNKLFEALMLGKPIISNRGISIENVIYKENCGILIEYGNLKELKRSFNILRDPQLRKELGKKGRSLYERKYSWKKMEKKLLNIYGDLHDL